MRLIRRRIRGFFALQAVILLAGAILGVAHPHPVANPLRHVASLIAYVVVGLLFAAAWWTTRTPSPYRNLLASAASLVSVAAGAYILWDRHASLTSASPGLIILAIGAAGLYLYAQGGVPSADNPKPSAPVRPSRPAPVAGDRTSPWTNRLFSAVSVLAQFASVYLWTVWARKHGLARGSRIPWYLLYTAAVLTSTIVHECGHAFVAWGCRMHLLSFNAGPLRWRKLEGKWTFKFNYEGFFDLGGAVHVVPTNPDQPRGHDLFMIAAGPLANIVCGLLAVWAIVHLSWPAYAQTWKLPAYFASFCFIAAITNLLPFRTDDGGYSDGARILQILTHSPLADYFRTMNALSATLVTDRRFRDLDLDAIERAAGRFPTQFSGLQLKLCASNVHQDANRLPEARAALAQAEAIYNNHAIDLPAPLHTVFIFDHAWLNRDPRAARLWWDRMEAKPAARQNVDYWLAKSALLWIERRLPEAEEAWNNAATQARELPEFGAYQFDRARCALLRHELDNPTAAPAPAPVPAASPYRQPERNQPYPRSAPIRATNTAGLRPIQPPLSQQARFDPLAALRPAALRPAALRPAALRPAALRPAALAPFTALPPASAPEAPQPSIAWAELSAEVDVPSPPAQAKAWTEVTSASAQPQPAFLHLLQPDAQSAEQTLQPDTECAPPRLQPTAMALPFRQDWLAASGQPSVLQLPPEPVPAQSTPSCAEPGMPRSGHAQSLLSAAGLEASFPLQPPAAFALPQPSAALPATNAARVIPEPRRISKAPPARVIPATPRLRADSDQPPTFDPLQFLRPSAAFEKNPT